MKKRTLRLAIHPVFTFLIFVFVARLCAYILQYRKTFASAESIEISIISTIVIIIALSVGYGYLIAKLKNKKD